MLLCPLQVQREVSRDSLLAREGLRMIYEMAIPRWHFHMLNDLVRNSSYSHAISAAVARIPDCTVLDIGSGTGLLRYMYTVNPFSNTDTNGVEESVFLVRCPQFRG